MGEKTKMVTYNLSLPESVYVRVRGVANKEGTTAKEVINSAIKYFLKTYKEV